MEKKFISTLYIISLLNIHSILNAAAANPALERSHSSSSSSDFKNQKTDVALPLASTPERTACSLALETDNFDWNNLTKQQLLSKPSTSNNSTASPVPSEQQIMNILQSPNLTAQHHRTGIAPSRPSTPIITTGTPQSTEQRQPQTSRFIHASHLRDQPVSPQPEIAAPKPGIALGIHKAPQATQFREPVKKHNNHNSESIIHPNGWDEPVRRQPTRQNNIRTTGEIENDEYEKILCGSKCCHTCCCTCAEACCDAENEKICGTNCCYNCCESCFECCEKNCEPSGKCCCRCMGITFCSPCIIAGVGFLCLTSPIWGPIACCIYGCSER